MQLSPQALPVVHILQQVRDGWAAAGGGGGNVGGTGGGGGTGVLVGLGGKGVLVGAGVEVGVEVATTEVATTTGVLASEGPLAFSSCPQAKARTITTSAADARMTTDAQRFMDVSLLLRACTLPSAYSADGASYLMT